MLCSNPHSMMWVFEIDLQMAMEDIFFNISQATCRAVSTISSLIRIFVFKTYAPNRPKNRKNDNYEIEFTICERQASIPTLNNNIQHVGYTQTEQDYNHTRV